MTTIIDSESGEKIEAFEIEDARCLAIGLANGVQFASDDPARPSVHCVQLEAREDELVLRATDSYVLIRQHLRWAPPDTFDSWTIALDRDDAKVAAQVLTAVGTPIKDEPPISVDVALASDGLVMACAGRVLRFPVPALLFPDTEQLSTDCEPTDGLKMSRFVMRRLTSLKQPGFKQDEIAISLDFSGSDGPVGWSAAAEPSWAFQMSGLVMPMATRRPKKTEDE